MNFKHPATFWALTVWVLMILVASSTYKVGATPPVIAGRISNIYSISQAQPSAGTTLRIDAGSSTDYIDVAGNLWVADTGFVGGRARARYTVPVSGTPDDRIYQSERYAMTAYHLPVVNGRYTVRLHFAEDNRDLGAVGRRVFGVQVENQSLGDIDVFAQAGALYKALIVPVDVTVSDQQLDILFTSKVDNPQIKGIEVLPLDVGPNPTATLTPTATSTQIPGATKTAAPTSTTIPPQPPATPTPTFGGPGAAPSRVLHLPMVMTNPPGQALQPCGDQENGDDTPEGATQLVLGRTCLGSLAGDAVNGDDWLYVAAPPGKTLVVDLANMPAGADYDLFVFDEQLKDGESNPVVGSNGPEHVEIPVQVAGRFYIRVVIYMLASGSNTYTLHVDIR